MEEQLLRELLNTLENGVSISTRSLILMLAVVGLGSVLGSYLSTQRTEPRDERRHRSYHDDHWRDSQPLRSPT